MIADKYRLNIAVYDEDITGKIYLLRETCETSQDSSSAFILFTNGGTHYKTIKSVGGNDDDDLQETRLPISSNNDNSEREHLIDAVQEIVEDLEGMKTDDLAELYKNVSLSLPDRNGYVVDFNPVLLA